MVRCNVRRRIEIDDAVGSAAAEKRERALMDSKMKKAIALVAVGAMSLTTLAACGNSNSGSSDKKGQVYYLNFKPEVANEWKSLAKEYTKETGVKVTVQTAASDTYEQRLKSEMGKSNPPTLFQVNGPVGYANWKAYTADMSDTTPYKLLKSKDYALTDGKKVTGIAYVVETYGLIYNKDLLDKYFQADWSTVKSMKDLNNFKALKTVADEIQAHKADLGVEGAFTSAGFDSSSSWRFKTHLANLPLYYELQQRHIKTQPATVKGTFLPEYKQIFDLYLKDSTTDPKQLGSKTGEDATAEFAQGKAVFYQNGTWAWSDLQKAGMKASSVSMMPIYIGVKGEEKQGLATGSENYWCINSKASEADQKATKAFLKWVVTSEAGKNAISKKMGFTTAFKGFPTTSDNPLVEAAQKDLDSGTKAVAWDFSLMPSEQWKNNLGGALLKYAQGTGSWNDVKTAYVDGWASEYKATH